MSMCSLLPVVANQRAVLGELTGFPKTRRKPIQKAQLTEVEYCSFLSNHGNQQVFHSVLKNVASVTQTNPAGNALQHSYVR